PATAQESFSKSREPTVWRTIPVLEFLQQSWENMANNARFSDLESAIHAGLANLSKWYHKIDDTNVYFICLGKLSLLAVASNLMPLLLALDPNSKVEYMKQKWEEEFFEAGMARLHSVVCASK